MRIGFYDPFLPALGGGEKYLLTMLEEATRRDGAEVVLVAPERPDPAAWRRLRVDVAQGAFTWLPGGDAAVTECSRDLDLLVVLANDVPPLSHAARSVALIQFPFVDRGTPARRAARALGLGRARAQLASYDRVLCNSAFTREHLRRRLGIDDALVVPPPVDPPAVAPDPEAKDPAILSIGRFFAGHHDKRHDVLIEAFRGLDAPGWELHLVGGLGPEAGSADHLERLRELATGLPVHFHVDAPAAELDELLRRSALLWHATGFGVEDSRHPERLEHFGIATVEGMMNAAVPLVVPAGAQGEIVADGETGFHWTTIPALRERTRELIADPARRARMGVAAATAARRFGRERFLAAVREHVF